MAVIQKLRDKYAKLTGAIIVIALLAFVFMDVGRGGGKQSSTVGEINGKKIDITKYDAAIKRREALYQKQMRGQSLTSEQEGQLRDQVWQQIVNQQVVTALGQKLGVTITPAEVNNFLTGPNPDPEVKQAFTNPKTGVFNPQEVSVQIQQIKNDPTKKLQWESFVNNIKQRHYVQKITRLLTGAIFVPKFVAQDKVNGAKKMANIQMVQIPFSSIPDNQVKVTDADINQYIQAHKSRFEVPKTTRSIKYITFKITPSSSDSAKVLNALDTLKNKFAAAKNVKGFVNHNSANATPPAYFTAAQLKPLPKTVSQQLENASVGQVVGPFFDGGSFDIARIMEKTALPDSVRSRHILVAISQGQNQIRSDSAAKDRINSAIAELNASVPFDSVAAKYSDDPNTHGTHNMGHVFNLSQIPGLVNAYGDKFTDFIFKGAAGQSKIIKDTLDNYTAYNFVQILTQTKRIPVTKIAFVSRQLLPSDNTYSTVRAQATKFITTVASSNGKTFEQIASAKGLHIKQAAGIDKNSFMIRSLGSAESLVKWAYGDNVKVGDVSPVYLVGNDFIVAKLDGIQPKGLLKINNQNKDMLRALVIKKKKAKLILDKYKTPPSTLQALAQQSKQTVATVDSIRFAQEFAPGLGHEPAVIGYAFNPEAKLNTVSPGIPGNEGVYFISVTARDSVPLPQLNAATLQQNLSMRMSRSANRAIVQSIVENADVEDRRGEIY